MAKIPKEQRHVAENPHYFAELRVREAPAAPMVRKVAPVKAKHGNAILTDEQVLECRALHEYDGVLPGVLATRYGVTPRYMYCILDYTTRSKLIPKPRPKS